MNYNLFIDLIKQFNDYNSVAIWIIDEEKIIFSTIDENISNEQTFNFLKQLIKDKSSIVVLNDIEYFTSMPCPIFNSNYHLIAGAYCLHPVNVGHKSHLSFEYLIKHEKLRDYLLYTPSINRNDYINYVNLLARILGNTPIDAEMITNSNWSLKRQLDRNLTKYVFETCENALSPYAPESERRILDMVKAGDIEGLKKINTSFFTDNPEHQIKYLYKIIALITLVTRAVIEAGAEVIDAYGLSDLYLSQLSHAKSDKQIAEIAKDVLPHFAELVTKKNNITTNDFSPHLAKAEKYIKAHLHFPLSLKEVAEHVGINEKYLSKLFVTCKNEKFTSYVNHQRINEAKELLINTDYKLIDIAYSLSFASESYFIKVFEESCGITPKKYRNLYKY